MEMRKDRLERGKKRGGGRSQKGGGDGLFSEWSFIGGSSVEKGRSANVAFTFTKYRQPDRRRPVLFVESIDEGRIQWLKERGQLLTARAAAAAQKPPTPHPPPQKKKE